MIVKPLNLFIFSIVMVMLLPGCGSSTSSTPTVATINRGDDETPVADVLDEPTIIPTPTPDNDTVDYQADDTGVNLLLEVEGEVLLRRINWDDFHPTTFGTALQRGDLLKVAGDAQAKVLCDNLNMWSVPSGSVPSGLNGCPRPEKSFLVREEGRIIATRGGDPTVPYIISPRSTKLLNRTPLLRWNNSGAASYNVQVRGGNLKWQQAEVTQTRLTYPGEPALQPGISYLLVVEDSNGKSSQDEGRAGLGFSLLDQAQVQQIQANTDVIAGLGLSDEAEAFAIAQLYAGNGLIAESIEILEALVKDGSQQASVHQALADLYGQIGLLLLAESRYLKAVELAEAQGNVEAMANIQANLGELYIGLGDVNEATRWLTQAQTGYEILGDMDTANEIAGRLEALK